MNEDFKTIVAFMRRKIEQIDTELLIEDLSVRPSSSDVPETYDNPEGSLYNLQKKYQEELAKPAFWEARRLRKQADFELATLQHQSAQSNSDLVHLECDVINRRAELKEMNQWLASLDTMELEEALGAIVVNQTKTDVFEDILNYAPDDGASLSERQKQLAGKMKASNLQFKKFVKTFDDLDDTTQKELAVDKDPLQREMIKQRKQVNALQKQPMAALKKESDAFVKALKAKKKVLVERKELKDAIEAKQKKLMKHTTDIKKLARELNSILNAPASATLFNTKRQQESLETYIIEKRELLRRIESSVEAVNQSLQEKSTVTLCKKDTTLNQTAKALQKACKALEAPKSALQRKIDDKFDKLSKEKQYEVSLTDLNKRYMQDEKGVFDLYLTERKQTFSVKDAISSFFALILGCFGYKTESSLREGYISDLKQQLGEYEANRCEYDKVMQKIDEGLSNFKPRNSDETTADYKKSLNSKLTQFKEDFKKTHKLAPEVSLSKTL